MAGSAASTVIVAVPKQSAGLRRKGLLHRFAVFLQHGSCHFRSLDEVYQQQNDYTDQANGQVIPG